MSCSRLACGGGDAVEVKRAVPQCSSSGARRCCCATGRQKYRSVCRDMERDEANVLCFAAENTALAAEAGAPCDIACPAE